MAREMDIHMIKQIQQNLGSEYIDVQCIILSALCLKIIKIKCERKKFT